MSSLQPPPHKKRQRTVSSSKEEKDTRKEDTISSHNATATTTTTTTTKKKAPPSSSAATSFLNNNNNNNNNSSSSNNNYPYVYHHRILVVGSGMSGLACARELQSRGYTKLLLVEARNRVGGRLKGDTLHLTRTTTANNNNNNKTHNKSTTYDSSMNVDLGGALIHGIEHNPLTHLVMEELHYPTRPMQADCILYHSTNTTNTTTTTTTAVANISTVRVKDNVDQHISNLFNECLEETFQRTRQPSLSSSSSQNTTTSTTKPQQQQQRRSHRPSKPTTTINHNGKTTRTPSFGDLFRQVCLEQGVDLLGLNNGGTTTTHTVSSSQTNKTRKATTTTNNHTTLPLDQLSLFAWHKANLEVSCGTSLEHLGYTWNDDEPYGYDGDHVALRDSWKRVVETLANGYTQDDDDDEEDANVGQSPSGVPNTVTYGSTKLPILYDSPVQRIHIVHPSKEALAAAAKAKAAKAAAAAKQRNGTSTVPTTTSILSSAVSSPATPTSNRRQSRRVRGVDPNVKRRSSRSNLGKMTDRYTIEEPETPVSGQKRKLEESTVSTPKELEDVRPKTKTVVQVTLDNGTVLEADSVVCTIPLGMLKLGALSLSSKTAKEKDGVSGGVAFDPPLPKAKQQAIRRLGAGLLNKCALSFPYVFWEDSDFLGLAAGIQRSYLILNGHAYTGKPILIFMYGGDFAKDIEDWTDEEIVEDCMKVLAKVCVDSPQIPAPIDYRTTRWGHEQYSRMAFTYIPPGVDGFSELQAMSEPIMDHTGTKPVLLFAGEHTTPYHPSTIHGAFLSGIREAYRLDMSLYPKHHGFEFSDKELYERTFVLNPKYVAQNAAGGQKDTEEVAAEQSNHRRPSLGSMESTAKVHRQHRRRGAAGSMNLRPRRTKSIGTRPVRDGTVVMWSPGKVGRDVSSLTDDVLLRGLESYGHDTEYLEQIALPVYGDGASDGDSLNVLKSSGVRKRCQQLLQDARKDKPNSTKIWKRFVAKSVYPPTTPGLAPATVVRSARIHVGGNKKTASSPGMNSSSPAPGLTNRGAKDGKKPNQGGDTQATPRKEVYETIKTKSGRSIRVRADMATTLRTKASLRKTKSGRLIRKPHAL